MASRIPGAAGPFVTGRGWFGDRGELDLEAQDLGRDWLEHLATWARNAVESSPKVGLLVSTRMRRPDPFGGQPEVYEDPDLWREITPARPKRAGSPAGTGDTLRSLAPGARARFWLGSPRWGDPVLLLVPVDDDPDGGRFRTLVSDARYRGLDPRGTALQGILQRLTDGRLALTSAAPSLQLGQSVRACAEAWGASSGAFWELLDARCVQLSDGAISDPVAPHQGRDLSTLDRVLPQLADSRSSVRAWFTLRADDRTPHLLVARTDAERARAAGDIGGDGPAVAGVFRWSDDGVPQLLCDRPPRDLTDQLAGWVAAWRHACPSLAHLRGLTVVTPHGDGQRSLPSDPALWAPLGD